jgi:NH3-dependent NAD+ synthetase
MSQIKTVSPALQPRRIDPEKTFDAIVAWIERKASEERAPGLIVGISGTDSILTFLASARAFENMGKGHKVLGVNFEHATKDKLVEKSQPFVCVKSDFNWVANDIIPWLQEKAPQVRLETDRTIEHSDDNMRWGRLFSRAVSDVDMRHGLGSSHYFPVGTRNATEHTLGTYSQLSKSVSMLPIIDLYKTEVLALCAYLGVPKIAMDKSREIDCDCGRFEVQANHMQELDYYIMYKRGQLSLKYLQDNVPPEVLNAVTEFYMEETLGNSYRPRTPYRPEQNLVVMMP